jgi:hypothetical protein
MTWIAEADEDTFFTVRAIYVNQKPDGVLKQGETKIPQR